MKYVLVVTCLALVVASVATYLSIPTVASDRPVLYWVTDNNPERVEQLDIFHRRVERLHAEDAQAYPLFEVRVDAASRDRHKQLVQGVSGVSGDLMDVFSTLGDHVFYHEVGMLADVTQAARELGFGPEHTYRAMGPEIVVNVWTEEGMRTQQVMFPCNVTVNTMFWVNRETFERHGLVIPLRDGFTAELFELLGKAFVQKANEGLATRQYFFADTVSLMLLVRSQGLDVFNETLTASHLGDERYARALELKHKWMYQDNLIPTAAEARSFAVDQVKFGPSLDLFRRGNYAMIMGGRYFIIQFREFNPPLKLEVIEHPHLGFRNQTIGTRAACVYQGGRHKDLAVRFLQYLTSEDYNMQVVESGDALPPNPVYTRTEAFVRPEGREGSEWGQGWSVHTAFSEAADTVSIGTSFSPFVNGRAVNRHLSTAEQRYMSEPRPRLTAAQIGQQLAAGIDEEIARTLRDKPAMRELHERLSTQQKQIEDLRARGEKVPLELIINPFYQRYYVAMGWSDPPVVDPEAAAAEAPER